MEPWRIRARRRRSSGSAIRKIELRERHDRPLHRSCEESRQSGSVCFEFLEWTALVEGLRPNKFGGSANFHAWQFFAGLSSTIPAQSVPMSGVAFSTVSSSPRCAAALPHVPVATTQSSWPPPCSVSESRSVGQSGFSVESATVWREAGALALCQGFGPSSSVGGDRRLFSGAGPVFCRCPRCVQMSMRPLRRAAIAEKFTVLKSGAHGRRSFRSHISLLVVRGKVRTLPDLERPCAPGLAVSVKCCPVLCHCTGVFTLPWWITQTGGAMANTPTVSTCHESGP